VVSGQLGGPIYDVVYRLEVPPASVIVASLRGTPGTDFDLYLFDASATTVVSNQGLLAQSIGPTSSESLWWPTRIGGTFYLDLNGATDVEGTYTLTVAIVPDPTPPSLSITLDGGASVTNDPQVSVLLAAFDDLSGVAEMRFSSDGQTWSAWEPFAPRASWTLGGGDGPHTVWAQVKNGVGLLSAPAQASIVLDTTPPQAVAIDPPPGGTVVGLQPTIRVTFSEPIAAASWTDGGLVVQSPTGALIPGIRRYDPVTQTGSFQPTVDLVPGYVYLATLGRVTDLAGNAMAPVGTWTLKALLPTRLTAAASPAVVAWGEETTLGGEAAVADGTSLDLFGRPAGADTEVAVGQPEAAAGRWTATVAPSKNTWYRVAFGGSVQAAPAQATVRVVVRRQVTLVGLPAAGRTVAAGTPVRLTGQAEPARAGLTLSFRLYRYDAVGRRWVYVGSFGRRTDGEGRASLLWTARPGRWGWRVAVLPDPEYANNLSLLGVWVVR
jgi:hypothetical protein